jgi:hypothetical protein
MTNINNINDPTPGIGLPKTNKPDGNKSDLFESALSKALDKPETGSMKSSESGALKEIQSSGFPLIDSSEAVSRKTDKLLDMLESYTSKLENPSISLKNIDADLEKIRQIAATLQKEANILGESDSQLSQIANQTVVAAQTEYFKFQRGDYI